VPTQSTSAPLGSTPLAHYPVAHYPRAALVVLAWAASVLPTALGFQQCAIATLFHVPCPGCGMTRAIRLLAAGNVAASLRMHPLAVPVLVAGMLLILSTIWATLVTGEPWSLHRTRFGRVALGFAAVAYVLAAGLWISRWFGLFGGPVPVW
jgi:hypothetical protein